MTKKLLASDLHKAAPLMYDALVDLVETLREEGWKNIHLANALEAIAMAEGTIDEEDEDHPSQDRLDYLQQQADLRRDEENCR
jgi:hypothetical protein